MKTEFDNTENEALNKADVSGSIFKGDCDKNIHWYVGKYSLGIWVYNECVYCKKRQNEY